MADTITDILKRYGQGAIFKLGDTTQLDIMRLPTGFIGLDRILGGGMPKGRIIEIFGQESSGKTTLCQHIIAAAQAAGGICAYIDLEHAIEPKYMTACAVDVNQLYISQPDTGEIALEIVEALVRSNTLDVIVVDSVAALLPQAEAQGEMGDAHMGLQARLMSQAMRKLSGPVKRSGTILIFINQIRSKIGGYGNPDVTSGGNSLKFYASVRLDLRKIKTLKKADAAYADLVRVKVVKNKTAPPFQEVELLSNYGTGFSKAADLLTTAVNLAIIDKSGSWYTYGSVKKQGEVAMIEFLNEEPATFTEIYDKCINPEDK